MWVRDDETHLPVIILALSLPTSVRSNGLIVPFASVCALPWLMCTVHESVDTI